MPTPRTSSQIPFGSTATVTASSSADFLQLVDADFGVLSLDGKIRAIGTVDPYEEAVAILTYLQSIKITAITCSHSIKMDFPNLSAGLHTIAGFLMVPMSTSGDGDFMVFFRKNQLKHVKWAGYVSLTVKDCRTFKILISCTVIHTIKRKTSTYSLEVVSSDGARLFLV